MASGTDLAKARQCRGYPQFTQAEWDMLKSRSEKAKMGIHKYLRYVTVEHELTPSKIEQAKKEMKLKKALNLIKKLKAMASKSKRTREQ